MEGAGQLLTMAAFLAFGAFLLPVGIAHASVSNVALAVLFLTVVRMLPIFISLTGTGLSSSEKLFLGWFGPRGLASLLFTMLMIDSFDFPNEAELIACVSLTVGLSILLHGFDVDTPVKLDREAKNEGPAQVNQTDRDTGLFATALILIAGLVFRLPDLDGRSTSYALGITADTTLGAKISPLADQNSACPEYIRCFVVQRLMQRRWYLRGRQSSP